MAGIELVRLSETVVNGYLEWSSNCLLAAFFRSPRLLNNGTDEYTAQKEVTLMQTKLSFSRLCLMAMSVLIAGPAQAGTMTVTASAYNSTPEQTDSTPHIGACNEPLKSNMNTIAVSPDLMKMGLDCGTKVKIDGMGEFVVLDKMDDKFKRRIDIHMGKKVEKAEQWGEKEVQISW